MGYTTTSPDEPPTEEEVVNRKAKFILLRASTMRRGLNYKVNSPIVVTSLLCTVQA